MMAGRRIPAFRRRRRILLLAMTALFAAVPVMFGLIRAISTGSNVRYLWLSGAALLGAAAVTVVKGDADERGPCVSLAPLGSARIKGDRRALSRKRRGAPR